MKSRVISDKKKTAHLNVYFHYRQPQKSAHLFYTTVTYSTKKGQKSKLKTQMSDSTQSNQENGEVLTEGSNFEQCSDAFNSLHNRLTERSAIIGIIGLGYVGLPLAHTLHSSGLTVVGFDTDSKKIEKLIAGISYIHHIKPAVAQHLSQSKTFTPTNDFTQLKQCDVLIMCLPTPVGPHNEPDMSFVLSTAHRIADILQPGRLVVLESTTYPSATDTDISEILNNSRLKLGHDYFLAYSPEREDPGNIQYTTQSIPKLLGGVDARSGTLAETLYHVGGFAKTIKVSSSRVAECAKLLENTYRAVNIALVNEMKQVFESMGVNIWEVLDAAETKPFGYHRFDPGPGIGGHCIPVDPFYLTWKAKETGAPCSFIELAANVNANMPEAVVVRLQAALNDEMKSVKGSHVLILGIAYKPNVDDIREAPALVVWERLLDLGAIVNYYDPFVPIICQTRKHMRLSERRSIEKQSLIGQLASTDAVILITHHSNFEDYEFLKGFQGPVIDTRSRIPTAMGVKIVRA